MISPRVELEKVILGACLLENAFGLVADILNHKNFSLPDLESGPVFSHQEIFQVFERFYPTRPIDLITVCNELKNQPGVRHYVLELAAMCSSAANIRFHAFCLLEMNFKNAFIKLLQDEFSSGRHSTITQAALQEIVDEALDSDNDIFLVIATTIKYLEDIGADKSLIDAVIEFSKTVDTRIAHVKRLSHIDALVNNLTKLNQIGQDTTTQMAISHITDVLKAIISTGRVKPEVANEIFKLKVA